MSAFITATKPIFDSTAPTGSVCTAPHLGSIPATWYELEKSFLHVVFHVREMLFWTDPRDLGAICRPLSDGNLFKYQGRFVEIEPEVLMISPVTSSNIIASEAAQARSAAPAAKPPANPPQDKVQLSPQASAGDVDHDGDSH
jgi:hypothetical protein